MTEKIYTIGFTQKSAEKFYSLIKENNISLMVDVRLNNISQLAGFSKFPDIEYFLREICNCKYISDKLFSPEEYTLKDYKANKIDWEEYLVQFNKTMATRKIAEHIKRRYSPFMANEKICFLCSENTPEHCHRRLIAERFAEIFDAEIVHLV